MSPFQPCLPNNASESHFGDVVAQGSGNSDAALDRRMMTLSMATPLAAQEPAFTLKFSNDLTNLHNSQRLWDSRICQQDGSTSPVLDFL